MAEAKKRVALLGAGYIAKWHMDALKRVGNVEVTAVCDLSEAAARGIAQAYGAPRTFTSLDEMLAAGVCDCVHVLTPPSAHFDTTSKILQAGLGAFVEKPLSLSVDDCRALGDIAMRAGAPLAVNHNFLMLPSYDRLKEDIKNGVIGPVDTFEANWQFPLPPLRSGPFGLWMLRAPGNILFEIGPHLFAFVADIFGELENIDVRLRNPIVIPGGLTHYQTWRISGEANGAAITLNLSLIEGHDNRSVSLRGLGACAKYDFAQDAYRLETAKMQDIIIGPFATQASIAGQALGDGFSNAARQLTSLNTLSPYGLSIANAVASFYENWRAGRPVDRRLSAGLAGDAAAIIENVLAKAQPIFDAAPKPVVTVTSKPSKNASMLVIGGTGFIGRALVRALADEGYDVRVFSRGGGSAMARPDGRVSVFTGDLKSKSDLLAAMQGVDGVFHLAKATETTWQGYLENDVAVTRLIGEACIEAGVKRLVYTGTIDSYDASQADRPITEETPFDVDLERRNLYARSKAACETALKELERTQNLPLVIARPGIVIGEGGPLQHWGIAMWRGANAAKLWGDGRNIMPFVLVDDVADGLVLAMAAPGVEGRSFNLIGDPMLSARDYFEAIEKANEVKMRAAPTPIWTYYAVDVVKYWAKRLLAKRTGMTKPSFRDWQSRAQLSAYENATAKQALGWRPQSDRKDFIQRGVIDANLFGIAPLSSPKPASPKPASTQTSQLPYKEPVTSH